MQRGLVQRRPLTGRETTGWAVTLTTLIGLILLVVALGATSASAAAPDAAQLTFSPVTTDAPQAGVPSAGGLVGVITNPVVASVLIIAALLLVIVDLTSGGVGIASALAVALFVLFFWGHVTAGLAGWAEIALVLVGLALIVLELLVIPGTGVAGLAGLVCVLAGLFLAQVGDPITADGIRRATFSVGATFVAVVAGLAAAVRLLGRYGPPRALVLETQLGSGEPVFERATGGWVRWFGGGQELVLDGAGRLATDDFHGRPAYLRGHRGVAVSDLRPSGVAEIDGERVDVVTAGGYVPAGHAIEVVRDDGYRRVVERVADDTAAPPP